MQVIQFIRILGHLGLANLSTRSNLHQTLSTSSGLSSLRSHDSKTRARVPMQPSHEVLMHPAGNLFRTLSIALYKYCLIFYCPRCD